MGYFLQRGDVNPAEVGSLLAWIYEYNISGFIGYQGREYLDKMLASLRECLFRQPQAVLEKVYASLVEEEDKLGLGKPAFAAAIDSVTIGGLESIVNPDRIVRCYIESVRVGDYALSARQISQAGAVSLVKLAQRSGDQWTIFLAPVDTHQMLARARDPGNNEFIIKDAISRSLRAHIRILCRAIAAWDGIPRDDLLLALINIIKLGAYAHEEKGKVSAFSAKYEINSITGLTEQPIANDLAAALRALQSEDHQALLEAILQLDEPLTLAQLLTLVPPSYRPKIEKRLGELSPAEAGQVWSLMAFQSRIDALLAVGVESPTAASLAAEYIENERSLKTLGGVPGRELERLRANLRLKFLQHDWDALAQLEYPSDPHTDLEAARDSINFYRAIAELQKPGGRPEAAVHNFRILCRKHPDISAYVNNLFAARISVLLKNDPFCLLTGEKAVQGREVLSESQQMVSNLPWQSRDDQALSGVNKALLLLALGQTKTAYDTLVAIHSERLQDTVTAYTAVALFRAGDQLKALEMLERAHTTTDGSKVIEAALAHIKGDAVVDCRVSLLSDEKRLEATSNAYSELSRMNPNDQASVVHNSKNLSELIFDYVRTSTAGITALVPMMKKVVIDQCEDDLNALIREILTARFDFLKWSVHYQSKGGYSGKGNPGERDILIKSANTTLAVIEAIHCDRPVTQQATLNDLASHFQKLLGYSECWCFVHLTYCYLEDGVGSVLEELKRIAKNQAPDGFIYMYRQDRPPLGSSPLGFVATYKHDQQEVTVLFLVLDMKQAIQREAAMTAAETKVNKGKILPVKPDKIREKNS